MLSCDPCQTVRTRNCKQMGPKLNKLRRKRKVHWLRPQLAKPQRGYNPGVLGDGRAAVGSRAPGWGEGEATQTGCPLRRGGFVLFKGSQGRAATGLAELSAPASGRRGCRARPTWKFTVPILTLSDSRVSGLGCRHHEREGWRLPGQGREAGQFSHSVQPQRRAAAAE